jgi:hypothetical protein
MGTPLSGYARRFVGAKGENGIQGSIGATGASGSAASTGVYTAYVSGGQTDATILTDDICLVSTVGATNASVLMKDAVIGTVQEIWNAGANVLAIYPRSGQNFIGYSANAPYYLSPNQNIRFVCFANNVYTF